MKKYVVVLWHLAYWIMYSFIVLLVYVGGTDHQNPPHLEGMAALKELLRLVFCTLFSFLATWPGVLGFYAYYFILFDKFLLKKKMVKLVLAAILVSILVPLLLIAVLLILRPGFHGELVGPGIAMAFIASIHGILGLVLRGFISWYADIKLKKELSKKNYDMELALLKAQVNPHFLFNTINNIDVLIQKEPVKASEYLNKLSDIMRFMLYETREDKILLSHELSYIEKYIGLQRIRTTNPDYIKFELQGEAGNRLIEPMLFIPFIENAFKHAENKKTENAIAIRFVVEKDKLIFECENVYSQNNQLTPEYGGLGNDLIRRRLDLLYPGRHSYTASAKNGIYKVNLVLSTAHEN